VQRVVPLCKTLEQRLPADLTTQSEAELTSILGRLATIAELILPAYAQLDEPAPNNLICRSDAEIRQLNATLRERVYMSARVLESYDQLGQHPPPRFRSWKIEKLQARFQNMTMKAPLLRKLVAYHAQLGQVRMDWELPAWSEEALTERCAQLEAQVRESRTRRQKEELIGKAEAAYYMRGEEPPFGLAMKSSDELRQHIKNMRQPRATLREGEKETS